jgi:CRP/FNR family transcriptional regulator, cyclic AMP receptor protein
MATAEQTRVDPGFVAQVAIFGGLPERALARILDVARVVRVPTGATVFEEGQPARSMFVVREGELEVYKRRGDGSEFRLALLHRGDCVGEMSLVEIQPRSASARALCPAALYVLDHTEIARLYQSDLEIYTLLVLNVAREISRRLRLADQRLLATGLPGSGLS